MKKISFLFLIALLVNTAFAQEKPDYKKRPAIGVHFTLTDFASPVALRANGLPSVMLNKGLAKARQMSPGIALSYIKGLSNHVDIQGRLSGTFLDLPINGRQKFDSDFMFAEADMSVMLKALSDHYWATPYLSVGIGASNYKGVYYGAFLPVGAGIQVNLYDEAFLLLNTQYRIPVAAANNYHFFHSIGFAGNIGKALAVVPKVPVVIAIPKDTDGDGIFDKDDVCPAVKGIAKYKGCPIPDSDKDGINDDEDKCITQPGTQKYQGCPVPDTDGDGVNDEEDKCPTVKGVARYEGCPVPDTDGDSVNDEEDKCKDVVGTAKNQGCPEIAEAIIKKMEFAAKKVLFETGSAKLKTVSYKPLNDVVAILKENQSVSLDIEGHTDNSGKADKNQALSQSRAAAVLAYIKAKGIDEARLTATGYGQDQPVADNTTAVGKSQNRRVELKLRSF